MKKGMTLVELMVSLVILMMVLGAVYSILTLQQTRATQVSKTAVLQTDAQVAFTMVKWDLMIAGIGYPYSQQDAIQLVNSGAGVSLKAVGLGFEMNRTHWSYILDAVDGTEIPVRRWPDSLANFEVGDTIVILDEMRSPLYDNLVITGADSFTYIDSLWGNKIPAFKLTIGPSIRTNYGLMVFKRNAGIYYGGLTYTLSGDALYRGSEVLLNNVETIQLRYGIDNDGDGIIESWGNANQPNPSYGRKWAIQFTMVVTSEAMPGYRYPDNTVSFEDYPGHTYSYNLTNELQHRKKRAILSSIVYPQNIQPEEGL